MKLVPDFSAALDELAALRANDVNLAEALDELAESGLPLLVCEIDQSAAGSTGDFVFSYKLSDQLKVRCAADRSGSPLPPSRGGAQLR